MTRTTIDFGIDLGTTNSEIAVLKGTSAELIHSNENMEFTPSAVWIDKNSHLRVGKSAKERIEDDPENAFCEFKRDMGTGKVYTFKSSGVTMRPEELSGEVLKSLKLNVKQRLNEDIESAVITVPAAFSLPQIEATRKAAALAGLNNIQCIQEPVAAAMAYGFQNGRKKVFWLVFDIGGGTFDAAIVRLEEGVFHVVGHSGDPFLGGKDVDWGIVEKLFIPKINNEIKINDFKRGNPAYRGALAVLKEKAEEAKIQLSTIESTFITADLKINNVEYEFEYELSRSEVMDIARPRFLDAIRICKKSLEEAELKETDIEKMILVGGPTLAPYARDFISDSTNGLKIPLEFSVDPLTVVAKGAAIYAGTQILESSSNIPLPQNVFQLELDYEPIGTESEPIIGGKVIFPEGENPDSFQIKIERDNWESGKIKLSTNGSFLTKIFAEPGKQNKFSIELFDSIGNKKEIYPNEFTYIIGSATATQTTIHTLGVALADNEVAIFFEKGQSLPARHLEILRTAVDFKRGANGEFLRIPVIEGENLRADRNQCVGALAISGNEISRDLPFGSEVEVTINMDKSRLLRTKAYVPILDQEFEEVINLQNIVVDTKQLKEEFNSQKERMIELRSASGNNQEKKKEVESIQNSEKIAEIESLTTASNDDSQAGSQAQAKLLELKLEIDKLEQDLNWPHLVEEAEAQLNFVESIVSKLGKDENRDMQAALEQETREAIQSHDADLLNRKIEELRQFAFTVMSADPAFWNYLFENIQKEKRQMSDPIRAEQLISEGNKAVQNQDLGQLIDTVRQLYMLLPQEVQSEISQGYGSGVLR